MDFEIFFFFFFFFGLIPYLNFIYFFFFKEGLEEENRLKMQALSDLRNATEERESLHDKLEEEEENKKLLQKQLEKNQTLVRWLKFCMFLNH